MLIVINIITIQEKILMGIYFQYNHQPNQFNDLVETINPYFTDNTIPVARQIIEGERKRQLIESHRREVLTQVLEDMRKTNFN